jgi:hypothetical protein
MKYIYFLKNIFPQTGIGAARKVGGTWSSSLHGVRMPIHLLFPQSANILHYSPCFETLGRFVVSITMAKFIGSIGHTALIYLPHLLAFGAFGVMLGSIAVLQASEWSDHAAGCSASQAGPCDPH